MITGKSFPLQQKNHYNLWWFSGLFVLPLPLLLMQQTGPGPAIVISRETTYITEPLKANGLPDYEKYVLTLSRVEVKPEDNAAVLLWQAIWPGDLEPADYEPLCHEIGLPNVPSAESALKPFRDEANQQRVLKWLQEQGRSNATPDTVKTLLDNAIIRPWKVADFPPLADWVRENRSALALIATASQKPKFYSPSPSLLNDIDEPIVEMRLPGPMMAREAARSLCVRAMGYLGEGDVDRAWRDIMGVHRLARLLAKGGLADQMVIMSINQWARNATVALLGHQNLSAVQARQIHRDIESLAEFGSLGDSLNTIERVMHLDSVLTLRTGNAGVWQEPLQVSDKLLKATRAPADWNIALRRGNQFYDDLVAIVEMPPGRARDEAIYQLHHDLDRLTDALTSRKPRQPLTNEREIGNLFARITVALFSPNLDGEMDAHERANTTLHLLRLAASLAVYRAEVGTYPEKLDDLVPRVLDKLPVDLYGARPFVYKRHADGYLKRHADGYLLYSMGRNGTDDNGSYARVLAGRPIDELQGAAAESAAAKIPADSDDVSILLPRPSLELP